ncbi:hypothetical protein [uncultured Methanobrevibacter sp.]|uniref:hypothetical protein n=1 Tax=uncultured Methanobrevibacter sp. TaxID=253161 RepID=UPI0025DD1D82|nr:hypothetical protein [uncultured Methanobrevibacter sp.]
MALTGTTIFSHILPVIFGFFGLLFLISGVLDDNKPKFGLGIVLFVVACAFPFVVLSALI